MGPQASATKCSGPQGLSPKVPGVLALKAEPHWPLREVGVRAALLGPGRTPSPSPALGLVSGRACQAELSARVKQEESTRGLPQGPALPTAGKNAVLVPDRMDAAPGQVLPPVPAVTTLTLPLPPCKRSRVRASYPTHFLTVPPWGGT